MTRKQRHRRLSHLFTIDLIFPSWTCCLLENGVPTEQGYLLLGPTRELNSKSDSNSVSGSPRSVLPSGFHGNDCPKTVPKPQVLRLLGLCLSEKQIPQVIVKAQLSL